jgi:hypothetical protein
MTLPKTSLSERSQPRVLERPQRSVVQAEVDSVAVR